MISKNLNRYICYFNRYMSVSEFKGYSIGDRITDYSQLQITRGVGLFNDYFYIEARSYKEATQVLDDYLWSVATTLRPNHISSIFFNAGHRDKMHVTCKNGTHAYLFTSGDSCEAFTFVRESSALRNKYDILFLRRGI